MVLLKGFLITQFRVFVLDTLLSTVFKDTFVCGIEFPGAEVAGTGTHLEELQILVTAEPSPQPLCPQFFVVQLLSK